MYENNNTLCKDECLGVVRDVNYPLGGWKLFASRTDRVEIDEIVFKINLFEIDVIERLAKGLFDTFSLSRDGGWLIRPNKISV